MCSLFTTQILNITITITDASIRGFSFILLKIYHSNRIVISIPQFVDRSLNVWSSVSNIPDFNRPIMINKIHLNPNISKAASIASINHGMEIILIAILPEIQVGTRMYCALESICSWKHMRLVYFLYYCNWRYSVCLQVRCQCENIHLFCLCVIIFQVVEKMRRPIWMKGLSIKFRQQLLNIGRRMAA